MIDEEIDKSNETENNPPTIKIDKLAIRFIYQEGQTNLFWDNLFALSPSHRDFQRDVMLNLKKLYDQCVRQNIDPETPEILT